MKAIIKEQGRTYTYYHVNHITIDNNTNSCIINYQDESDEECEEIGLMCPDFNLQFTLDKLEQPDELKVGDEVYVSGTKQNAIITALNPYGNGKLASIIFPDGNTACRDTSVFVKTGRHFQQIEDILKEMEV